MISYKKFSYSLTLEAQIVWKISAFNAIDGSIKKLLNFQTFQLK